MTNTRAHLSVLLVLAVSALVKLAGCGGEVGSPTGTSSLDYSSASRTAAAQEASSITSAGNSITAYTNESSFLDVLTTSTVRTVSQDLSQTGTDVGGETYELNLGGVRIRMRGPAFYGNLAGVDLLSKGVPLTVFLPPQAQGAGLAIAQLSLVRVTATSRDGETLVLDPFSNGSVGFLGFTAEAGIASIEFTDPNPSDTTTPITNIADITFGAIGPEPLPLSCSVLGERRPSIQVDVQGTEVRINAIARGIGIPEEVNIPSVIENSLGRFGFWPNGRHNPPKVVSELFPTMRADDFPARVELFYQHSSLTAPTRVDATLDYEVLSACRDEASGQLVPGGLDEFGTCLRGEYVILQCDRGFSYTIN
jgi:hypothetical protein